MNMKLARCRSGTLRCPPFRRLAAAILLWPGLLVLSPSESPAAAGASTSCVTYIAGRRVVTCRVDPAGVQSFQLTVAFDSTRLELNTDPGGGLIFKTPFTGLFNLGPDMIVVSGSTAQANVTPGDSDVYELVFNDLQPGLPIGNITLTVGGGAGDFIQTYDALTNMSATLTGAQIGPISRSVTPGMSPKIWDPDGVYNSGLTGGAGVWDLSSNPRFDGLPTLVADQVLADAPWDNLINQHDFAVFGGNPGTGLVTVGGNISTSGLQFDMQGYHLSGGNLTLSAPVGSVPTIEVRTGEVTVDTPLAGSGGFTKSGAGTLILGGSNTITGNVNIATGAVKLAGGTNTLSIATNLAIGGAGTLDLDGNSQFVNTLTGAGGTITSAGAATFVINSTVGNFAGQMTGSLSLVKASTGGATFTSSHSYTGSTLLAGGTTTLRDGGALANTSAVGVNYGALTLDNTGTQDHGNRVNDGAPVTLRGGSVTFISRAQTASGESLGAVTVAEGLSTIAANAGSLVGSWSATLTLASLTPSPGATVNFTGTNLGLTGNAANILITGAPLLSANLIGGWALAGGTEFASYNPSTGVGALSQTGYAGYNGTALPAGNQAAQNIRMNAAGTVPLGGSTVNSLNLSGTTNNLGFAAGNNVLNLVSGGLLKSANVAATIGTVVVTGQLTAGGAASNGTAELYLSNNPGTLTVNSQIVDNPNGAQVRLVVSNLGGSVALTNPNNSYTGGTVVNGGTGGSLLLQGTGTVLPAGGLTLNGGAVTQSAGANIAVQDVTLNGSSALNLANQSNTLHNLDFHSNGGTAPIVNPAGTLKLTGAIISTPTKPGAIAAINGGTLDLNANTAFPISVASTTANGVNIAPNQPGLAISSLIQNGGIAKTGSGVLQLASSTSSFAGGVALNSGSLMIGANSNPSTVGASVTGGPLGTGPLTIAAGTTILGSAGNTIANAVSVTGDFAFGGGSSANNLTLNGPVNLNNAARRITVSSSLVTATIGSPVSNGTQLTKDGPGALVLSGTNTFSNGTTILDGTLTTTGSLVSSLAVNAGVLGGGGTIAGAVVVGDGLGIQDAFIHPSNGSAPGSLSVGSLSLNSDAVFEFTLDSSTVLADPLFVNGNVSLGNGVAELSVLDLSSVALPIGTVFTVIDNLSGATTGFFNGLPDDADFFAGANEYNIDYHAGPGGNNVQITAVPEADPATALAATLLLAAGTRRLRSRRG